MTEVVIAAAVQATPVFLDREATIDKVVDLTAKAAAEGAGLVVFPEAFVPTYPDWVWRTPAWSDRPLYEALAAQAVTVPSAATDRMGEAALAARAWLAVGVNEKDRNGATLYNTLLYFAPDGTLAALHRKLVATGGERTIWGQGDGSTLTVLDTVFGRLGGLICWENYMPLARAALYARGLDVYLAPTWDTSDCWLATLRHIAKEGRVFVIGTNSFLRGSDVPVGLPGRDALYGGDEDYLSRGGTAIVGPDGTVLAGPLHDAEGILFAEIDVDVAKVSRREFDPIGHYARPDVFSLSVDVAPRPPATFVGQGEIAGRT
ncbi:MAG: carbon-nitrogen hydrolase family protein [Actinomycetota bacterium]|nr:carbon-nitrogen hydrolase family protein [Actinomycetota bacterium]